MYFMLILVSGAKMQPPLQLGGTDRHTDSTSLARATPVWKNRGLVTALHTTSSDGMQLADTVGRAAVAELTKCKDGVNNN